MSNSAFFFASKLATAKLNLHWALVLPNMRLPLDTFCIGLLAVFEQLVLLAGLVWAGVDGGLGLGLWGGGHA